MRKTVSYIFTAILFLFLLSSCGRKRNNPFCFSCEKGTLIYPEDNPRMTPLFIKENGDTISLLLVNADVFFEKGGRNACVKMKKSRIYKTDLTSPVYDAKCIKKE